MNASFLPPSQLCVRPSGTPSAFSTTSQDQKNRPYLWFRASTLKVLRKSVLYGIGKKRRKWTWM